MKSVLLRMAVLFLKNICFFMFFQNCCGHKLTNETLSLDSDTAHLPLTYETLTTIFDPDWESNKPEESLHLKADEILSTPDLVQKSGYPSETYEIITEDDYVLTLHRIPYGKQAADSKEIKNKPVVLIQHGLLQSSEDWLRNEAESLPYKLVEENYDVWLSNSRGNKYSNEHLIFMEDTLEFYNFSFHEMGRFDIPAIVDFILDTTNQTKLTYVGCSLGTTVFWVTMSTLPEYSTKINFMAALSPIAFLNHTTSPVKTLGPFIEELKVTYTFPLKYEAKGIFSTLRTKRFNPPKLQSIVNSYLPRLCFFRLVSRSLCKNVNQVLADFQMSRFENHHVQLLGKYAPTTTSINTMIHFLQLIRSDKFQHFDYGSEAQNLIAYGMRTPPIYNLSAVDLPVAIFSGTNDAFSSQKDVNTLKSMLPNVVEHVILNSTFKTHIDYTHEAIAVKLVYEPLIKMISKFNHIPNVASTVSTI